MAAFSSLTAQQQKAVKDFSTALRGSVGDLARTLNRLRALNASYTSTAQPILALLTAPDDAVAIVDDTGLAGSMPLTPAEMTTLLGGIVQALQLNDNAHLLAWAKAVGPGNLVG